MTVYKQKKNWDCGNYAYLVAMNNQGIMITEQEISSMQTFLTHRRAWNLLKDKWLKTEPAKVLSVQILKNYLNKWYYIVAYTSLWNFEKWWKDPILELDWDQDHFFVIKSYDKDTDLFQCQNSWGPKWWINWDFFMKIDDIVMRKMQVRRIVN